MVIAFMQVELRIPESRSLKAKRMVVRSIKDRTHNKFNVSIAEIDYQNIWDSAIFGIACVATDQKYASQVLESVVQFIQSFPQIQVIDYCVEML
ncbi:MAG: DUF503 domain-containing protein [Candidatus Auribacterota bacterium]|jgi:uncharacterized protein YlxP (DUF503 family)|nr:DUF503 domain-containing protein [Candidatus Auribacterota bacterium]